MPCMHVSSFPSRLENRLIVEGEGCAKPAVVLYSSDTTSL